MWINEENYDNVEAICIVIGAVMVLALVIYLGLQNWLPYLAAN